MNITDLSSLKLSDIMTPDPITLSPEDNILEKGRVFKENNLHHIPVVTLEKEVVGMVSSKDIESFGNILKIMDSEKKGVPIKEIMTVPIFSYYEDVPVAEAAKAMIDNQIHAIVVADKNGKMVGIVTSTDILKLVAKLG